MQFCRGGVEAMCGKDQIPGFGCILFTFRSRLVLGAAAGAGRLTQGGASRCMHRERRLRAAACLRLLLLLLQHACSHQAPLLVLSPLVSQQHLLVGVLLLLPRRQHSRGRHRRRSCLELLCC